MPLLQSDSPNKPQPRSGSTSRTALPAWHFAGALALPALAVTAALLFSLLPRQTPAPHPEKTITPWLNQDESAPGDTGERPDFLLRIGGDPRPPATTPSTPYQSPLGETNPPPWAPQFTAAVTERNDLLRRKDALLRRHIRDTYATEQTEGRWLPVRGQGGFLPQSPTMVSAGSSSGPRLASAVQPPQSGPSQAPSPPAQPAEIQLFIATDAVPAARLNERFEYALAAVGGVPPYQWEILSQPERAGLSLDPTSGVLTALPRELLTGTLRVRVRDQAGETDEAAWPWIVEPESPLVLLPETLPPVAAGQPAAIVLQPRGGLPPYTLEVAGAEALPSWAALDAGNFTLLVNPPPSAAGLAAPVALLLSDAQVQIAQNYILNVTTPSPPSPPPNPEPSPTPTPTPSPSPTPSPGPSPSPTPEPSPSPSPSPEQEPVRLSSFEALLSLRRVALSWTPPPGTPLLGVRIVRKSGSAPAHPMDGQPVYEGSATEFVDESVPAGTLYYAAFAVPADETRAAQPLILQATMPPATGAFASAVTHSAPLHPTPFGHWGFPEIVLGSPQGAGLGAGSLHVYSLGASQNTDSGATAPYGGSITLEFPAPIWNGPGADFTVFENVFYLREAGGLNPEARFMEPASVAVSQDGSTWFEFPMLFSPRYRPDGTLNVRHPFIYARGFAGINPVLANSETDPSIDPTDPRYSGGDSFDLDDIGLPWVRFVRIQSTGHLWRTDSQGALIHHNTETGATNRAQASSGFDLDAAARIWIERVVAPQP